MGLSYTRQCQLKAMAFHEQDEKLSKAAIDLKFQIRFEESQFKSQAYVAAPVHTQEDLIKKWAQEDKAEARLDGLKKVEKEIWATKDQLRREISNLRWGINID